MKKTMLFILLMLISASMYSQVIKIVNHTTDVKVKVYSTDNRAEADLFVYVVTNITEAKGNNGRWYFTNYYSPSDKKVYFVKSKVESNVIIYFTKNKAEAGWKKPSKQYLFY